MTHVGRITAIVADADAQTRSLVRAAAVIAAGTEEAMREAFRGVLASRVPTEWVEELILQSYLFVGFPRTLNAAREWRRISGVAAPPRDEQADIGRSAEWVEQGEQTCEIVYGASYERLRANIRQLHPALDAWMIADGYGKVLSRPGLDLARRELCIVAVCAVTGQERQLHAHLHGAQNAGASPAAIADALAIVCDMLPADAAERCRALWTRVERQ
jgi:4-carboxymuconolactone decarboxylase